MTNRRYYLLAIVCLGLALPEATVDAQSSATSVTPTPDCKRVNSVPVAMLPDSAESSTLLVDCGKELADQNDYAGSRRVFERAIEMARRRGDRRSLASALYGYGGVLIAVGDGDRAEPLLVENGRISEEIGDKNGMAEASSALGRLRNMQARYDEARIYHMRSFELWN